jgi:hypothetical protein
MALLAHNSGWRTRWITPKGSSLSARMSGTEEVQAEEIETGRVIELL